MDRIVNTEQSAAWNGYEGEHWATNQARYDAVNRAFNPALVAAADIHDGTHVLDVGCGTGETTREAASLARAGSALGVDLSAPMVERARQLATAQGVGNVNFEHGDVQVYPFPPAGFDAAISRFGMMFFSRPIDAFSNVERALRPGGRLAMVTLRGPDEGDLSTVLEAMARPLPPTPDPSPTGGRFSLADPSAVEGLLVAAGFSQVSVTPIDAEQVWGTDAEDAARFLTGWGPVRHRLALVDDELRERARAATLEAFRAFERDGGVTLSGAGWLVRARAGA